MTLIDGKPVLAQGTLLIPPGRSGSIQLGNRRINLHFVDGPAQNLTHVGDELTFIGFNNQLGSAVGLTGLRNGTTEAGLDLAIQTIGSENPHRVIHYVFYEA